MINWAGIFALSAIMKRKIYIPKSLMGSYTIYPSLYLVFVAPPGVARKSTTVGYAQTLLEQVAKQVNGEQVNFAPDVTSYSRFTAALAATHDGSMTVIANEFANIVRATPEAMYETLTELFDNRSKFTSDTWTHGTGMVIDPVVNLIAATTPDWVAQQPAGYFVGGGFASRVIFVVERSRRTNQLYYDHLDQGKLEQLEKDLADDLHHISQLKGPFTHESKKTHDYIEEWYRKHAVKEADDSSVEGYLERKHIHAHKIAMLLSIARSDSLKISKADWDEAVRLLDDVERKLPKALTNTGRNPLGPQMQSVLDYIEKRGSATLKDVARRFWKDLTLDQVQSILVYLVTGGFLECSGSKANPKYEAK